MTYQPTCIADEIWKPVPSLDGYFASNLGRLKSIRQFKLGRKERILGSLSKSIGYFVVNLSINGRRTPITIHSLVAETFLGPRPPGLVVNHKNHDRTDNRIENLEYITQKQNVAEAIKAGRWNKRVWTPEQREEMSRIKRGIPDRNRPLTKEQADEIRKRKPFCTSTSLAKEYGVSKKAVLNIVHNRTYRH